MAAQNRSVVLDVFRALAVVLVLGRHLQPCPAGESPFFHAVTTVWNRGGWMGVDLFFVLSGFLVSGLLFQEHQTHGEVRIGRFLLRRGLKIYPAFLAFLLVATLCRYFMGTQIGHKRLLVELLFLQNYFPSVWFHTWSLAVEEHFYSVLPFALLLLFKRFGRRPLKAVGTLFVVIATVCLAFRVLDSGNGVYEFYRQTTPTHKRIDSLFAGVLLAAFFYKRRTGLRRFAGRFRFFLVPCGLLLLTPPFIWPIETTPWLWTFGYTLIYLGAAMLLAVAVTRPDWQGRVWRVAARMGRDSYSIYLWHAAALVLIAEPLRSSLPASMNWFWFAGIYLAASLGLGIFMSKVVEWPVLRLRDRYFPSRSRVRQPVETVPSTGETTPGVLIG